MKQRPKKQRSFLSVFFLLICIISLVVAGYLLWGHIQEETTERQLEEETLEKFVQTPEDEKTPEDETGNPSPGDGYTFDWDEMRSVNPDVVGWIRFDNPSRISYPIVQGDSNQTYLTRNWRGQYSIYGSIFLNKNNASDFTDANSILYGHRMISGAMFGDLKKYGDQSFLDANPYFYVYTPDGRKRTYEIYVYAQVRDASDVYTMNFESTEEKLDYFEDMKARAITSRNVELGKYDTIMTLSTCASYGYMNRMVVQGKLISIEENQ